jgi:hypothetical protein
MIKMAEKKKSNIEIWREKKKVEKETKIVEPPAVEEEIKPIEQVKDGQIKCKRCGKEFAEINANPVKLFGKLGCPVCGFPVDSSK